MAAGCPPCRTPALQDQDVAWDRGTPAPCRAPTAGGPEAGWVWWGEPQGTPGDLAPWVHAQRRWCPPTPAPGGLQLGLSCALGSPTIPWCIPAGLVTPDSPIEPFLAPGLQ